jgi:hypothetical protein
MTDERIRELWAQAMQVWLADENDFGQGRFGPELYELFARLVEREVVKEERDGHVKF